MKPADPNFDLRLAQTAADLKAAQRLRYRVFIEELGGDGPMVDHEARLEMDAFDAFFDHLLLIDTRRDPATLDHVVGVYRVMRSDQAALAGQFYSEDEYDLGPLHRSGRRLLELGRSCVDAGYRGGTSMFHLWNGLGFYVLEHDIEVMFGVASFHGTDIDAIRLPLSCLHHQHLAPEALRVLVRPEHFRSMDLMPADQVDRKQAMKAMPTLIKAYLRLGGFVGDGAFIDHSFNTTDVFMMMDTEKVSARQRKLYTGGRRG
jgi:putative hemolysin